MAADKVETISKSKMTHKATKYSYTNKTIYFGLPVSNEWHTKLQVAWMRNSPSVADYITRGQLLPGPVLQTVTHSRDIKSLNDNKTTEAKQLPFVLVFSRGKFLGMQANITACSFCCGFIFSALWVYLSKQLLLKAHALSLAVRHWASEDSSLNTDRFIM